MLGIEIGEDGDRSKEAEHEREEGVRDEDSLICHEFVTKCFMPSPAELSSHRSIS